MLFRDTLDRPPRAEPGRRFHDLDALRAFAMLLGIVYHAVYWGQILSPAPPHAPRLDGPTVLFTFIHGFRMPLFMLLSGFFTALLWRRRGAAALLRNRFTRVFLPLLVFTPVVGLLALPGWLLNPRAASAAVVESSDPARLQAYFATRDINATGIANLTPLLLAAQQGRTESARWLIAAGADLTATTPQVALYQADTALDLARKGGFVEIEKLLVAAGAPALSTHAGYRAPPLVWLDFQHLWFLWVLWLLVLGFIPVAAVLERLPARGFAGVAAVLARVPVLGFAGVAAVLARIPALGFAGAAAVLARVPVPRRPAWLILTPARYLWLVPLTFAFQSRMTTPWGPDTYSSVCVPPVLLGYYAVFFAFGALYYVYSGEAGGSGRDTRHWPLELPLALLVVFPLGLTLAAAHPAPTPATDALMALYAWLMIFGGIGLFRRLCARDNPTVRYVADSSYFLYIMHMPALIVLSNLLARYAWPEWLKTVLMCLVTVGALLFLYEHLVRYRRLGRWLNGPRVRTPAAQSDTRDSRVCP